MNENAGELLRRLMDKRTKVAEGIWRQDRLSARETRDIRSVLDELNARIAFVQVGMWLEE
jgi:hypothetical protein